jgi:hypothetical protein
MYFIEIWYILWKFSIFNGNLVYFRYIISHFVMLYHEKFGNPFVYANS